MALCDEIELVVRRILRERGLWSPAPFGSMILSSSGPAGSAGPGSVSVAARAHRNAALSLTAGVATKVPLDTVDFDSGYNGGPVYDAANSRFTIPTGGAGYYRLRAQINGSQAGANPVDVVARLYRNGSLLANGSLDATGAGSVATDLIYLQAGDYIELFGLSQNGGALVVGASTDNYLAVDGGLSVAAGAATPAAFPQSGLWSWYTADKQALHGGAAASNNQTVTLWQDRSGNGRDLTVPTGHTAPTWKSAGLNALPMVQWQNTTDVLLAATGVHAGEQTICYVGICSGGQEYMITDGASQWLGAQSSKLRAVAPLGQVDDSGLATSATPFSMIYSWKTGVGSNLYVNGTKYVAAGSAGQLGGNLYLSDPGGVNNISGGSDGLSEIITYNRQVTDAEATLISTYLRNRWATP